MLQCYCNQKDKTMTRKEEIAQAFREIDRKYHYDALAPACLDMAEWADKTMIEKACNWLNNFYSEERHCYLVAEDIEAFKQAMEE